jgi:hypothetical protein
MIESSSFVRQNKFRVEMQATPVSNQLHELQLNARIGATVPAAASENDTASAQTTGTLDQRQLLSMLTSGAAASGAATGTQPRPAAPTSGSGTAGPGGISAANLSAILAGLGRGGGAGMQVT